ncbi:MAG: aconitase family protein, partial [Geminicoccaceae bacterium]
MTLTTTTVATPSGDLAVTDLPALLGDRLRRLPHILRLLAENHLRQTSDIRPLIDALDAWLRGRRTLFELTFRPNRLLMHDTTCTPALADIAGLRDALAENGADPDLLSPTLPVEVSVDHSVAVDAYARPEAIRINRANEIARNAERYAFMKWASRSMDNLR